jgi:hypothetical protein
MIINLTPHAINIGSIVIEPSGSIARISSTSVEVEAIEGIRIQTVTMGKPEGLPNQEAGVYLLVSAMVRSACAERKDLLSPGEQERNASGQVIGCKTLISN